MFSSPFFTAHLLPAKIHLLILFVAPLSATQLFADLSGLLTLSDPASGAPGKFAVKEIHREADAKNLRGYIFSVTVAKSANLFRPITISYAFFPSLSGNTFTASIPSAHFTCPGTSATISNTASGVPFTTTLAAATCCTGNRDPSTPSAPIAVIKSPTTVTMRYIHIATIIRKNRPFCKGRFLNLLYFSTSYANAAAPEITSISSVVICD